MSADRASRRRSFSRASPRSLAQRAGVYQLRVSGTGDRLRETRAPGEAGIGTLRQSRIDRHPAHRERSHHGRYKCTTHEPPERRAFGFVYAFQDSLVHFVPRVCMRSARVAWHATSVNRSRRGLRGAFAGPSIEIELCSSRLHNDNANKSR
jgi:hypothetical protein